MPEGTGPTTGGRRIDEDPNEVTGDGDPEA